MANFDGNGCTILLWRTFFRGRPRKVLLPDPYEAPIAEVEHVERETESHLLWGEIMGS